MEEKFDLSISLVTYRNDRNELTDAINSVLQSVGLSYKLYIVDNSPTDIIRNWFSNENIEYIFNNRNIGFGAAHNIIMKDTSKLGRYHLVLNPDIKFNSNVLRDLVNYMDSHKEVGNIIPKVYYPNGTLNPVCRLLPTPFDFFLRMFVPLKSWRKKTAKKYLMSFCDFKHPVNAPYLSGCFMFLRTKAIEEVGVFDEAMFMYAEDVDLSRRIHKKYKTIYYPELKIIHVGANESHSNIRLMKIHIRSTIYYFNKWGWFFDKERKEFNKRAIVENTIYK